VARQERPVDPAAGPLQSLAYDLRKLRVENGGMTYRALARKTGYSASTLSEAASGNRKPTLDVLLAYVGALNGDPEEWRARWAALDSSPQPSPAPSPEPAASPARWSPSVLLRAALVVVVVAAGALWLTWRGRSTPEASAAAPGCPAVRKSAKFTARTYGSGATVRLGPARVNRSIGTVPPGCTIGLIGYCVGEVITDETAHTPDVRWFMVDGGGVIASAIVHGNPPDGMGLSRCPGDRPAPSAVALEIARDPGKSGQIRLSATGRDVDVVGYAAYYADSEGAPESWHQIGLTGRGTGAFALPWQPGVVPAGARPVLAAAACLGGESPTDLVDLKAFPAGDAGLDNDQRTAAGRVACLYPVAKLPATTG
jgi:transcriptional regulator with XRE-family HTH domain